MKITKLSKGYRINLSDTELSLLRAINDEGIQILEMLVSCKEFDWSGLASSEIRILTQIRTDKRKWL